MPQFFKKPVVVEAVQWHQPGDHPAVMPHVDERGWHVHRIRDDRGGVHPVNPGDWIITAANGQVWPVSDDYMWANYDPVPVQ